MIIKSEFRKITGTFMRNVWQMVKDVNYSVFVNNFRPVVGINQY